MTLTRDQIKSAALKLGAKEREALAAELLVSIDAHDCAAIDTALLAEVRRRDAGFEAGVMKAKPVDEVIARLSRKGQP